MRIYLYLKDKVLSFVLPREISGSFSFDPNVEEESKLINIEARDGKWVLYSTDDVNVIADDNIVKEVEIQQDNFYILYREETKYLILITNLHENYINAFSFDQTMNMVIGNTSECNIQYQCQYLNGIVAKINVKNGQVVLAKATNTIIYVNKKAFSFKEYFIKLGDCIEIYGLKILFIKGLIFITSPKNKLNIEENYARINNYFLAPGSAPKNIEIKDVDLYDKNAYFSKSPRIRRIIETKTIKLSPPPKPEGNNELPMILTVGPMFTMGIMSLVMLINTLDQIYLKETTIEQSWPSLVTSGAMLISMVLWPLLTRIYNNKMKEKRKKEIEKKYSEYLKEKEEELIKESKLQKEILIENLITVKECSDIIINKSVSFWDKRIDQNDFLIIRIGIGNDLLNVKVEYPEEGFTIEEDNLRKQADALVEKYKYIENIPIGYSLYENKITAIMGNRVKSICFVNNILVQLLAFYSYEDLKIVMFTDEEKKSDWDYIKYLNHNFNNNKRVRFFSSTQDTSKSIAEILNIEFNNRLLSLNSHKENHFKPYYIIITDNYERIKRFDFIRLLTEHDENLGCSILILENRISRLPSKCNNFITLGDTKSGVLRNSYEKQEQTIFTDEIDYTINMMNLSKITSNIPIEFEEGIKQLPDIITFLEMEKVGKVEQLNILNRWRTNDSTVSLKAEIGVDEEGELMYLDLHEKYHGPHGLIAGMTGSGKSEFIITYILSMAINYSPDDVAFILIDYKGGGLAFAFENKSTQTILPHLAGTITNLDKAEMDRTLVSIDSEVKRRQKIFNEAREQLGESTIDIYKYQKYFKEGKLNEPIPHLFIICDEFAELKSQQPDFMDNLISVARIGRSLGVHLILATQKPSGVVNDQIWSNTKFRVCLKVQDESDSKEMLKRPEAASLKQTGRFYLQVGYDEYFALGQSGWCGAKYYPSEKIKKQVDKSINFIDDCGRFIKNIQATSGTKSEAQGEQLAAIMNSIISVANQVQKRAKRLWLDNIPETILINEIEQKYQEKATPYKLEAIIGEYDAPEKQLQGLVKYNLISDGNTSIYGNDGSETELLISTIIYSIAKNHTPEEFNCYIIDYGSESLRKYEKLPHIGGIVYTGEEEKYNNLLKLIKEELVTRKKLFSDYGGEWQNYINNSGKKMPVKLIVLNNYDSIYESNPGIYDELPDLIRDSERYGIVFILTGNAPNSIHSKISQNCSNIYAFKLKDVSDYTMLFGQRTKTAPREIVGRGLLKHDGIHEFQTAKIIADDNNLNKFIINFIKEANDKYQTRAKSIPSLPEKVTIDIVKEKITSINDIPVGITKKDLEIYTIDYLANIGNIITSYKLTYTESFVKSLLENFRNLKNTNIIIFDPFKQLNLSTSIYKNYCTENIDRMLNSTIDYIKELKESQEQTEGIILIFGINKFISKLQDQNQLTNLAQQLKEYEKISLLIVDDVSKIKSYTFETWFTTLFNVNDGIWIGRGIADQNLLHLSTINKEMTKNYKNDMGYIISEGVGTLCKMIDYTSEDEEESNGK